MMGLLYRAADALRRRAPGADSGRTGEDLAHRYLRRRGCTIVARNYRTRSGSGEVDLIAWDGGILVFVEVKTRLRDDFGEPATAVDHDKRELLKRAARDYARRADVDFELSRFDIVSVLLSKPPRIDWQRDAFSGGREP